MASGAMSSNTSGTVRCPNCGYVTHPVSAFCPRCLSRLPQPATGLAPRVLFGMVGLVALGLTLVADAALLARDSRAPSVAVATSSPSAFATSASARQPTGPASQLDPPTSSAAQSNASVGQPTSSPAQQILPSTNSRTPDGTATAAIATRPDTLPDTATPTSASASRLLRTGRVGGPSGEGDAVRSH